MNLAFGNAGSGEAEEYDEDHLPEDGADHYSFSHTRHGVAFRHGEPAAGSTKKSAVKAAKTQGGGGKTPHFTRTKKSWLAEKAQLIFSPTGTTQNQMATHDRVATALKTVGPHFIVPRVWGTL